MNALNDRIIRKSPVVVQIQLQTIYIKPNFGLNLSFKFSFKLFPLNLILVSNFI